MVQNVATVFAGARAGVPCDTLAPACIPGVSTLKVRTSFGGATPGATRADDDQLARWHAGTTKRSPFHQTLTDIIGKYYYWFVLLWVWWGGRGLRPACMGQTLDSMRVLDVTID